MSYSRIFRSKSNYVAASARNHDIAGPELDAAERDWEGYWTSTRPVELTTAVERHAGQLARDQSLLGAHALHLASALAIGDPDLIVAVWDRRLHAGALASGCRVAPAKLDEQQQP